MNITTSTGLPIKYVGFQIYPYVTKCQFPHNQLFRGAWSYLTKFHIVQLFRAYLLNRIICKLIFLNLRELIGSIQDYQQLMGPHGRYTRNSELQTAERLCPLLEELTMNKIFDLSWTGLTQYCYMWCQKLLFSRYCHYTQCRCVSPEQNSISCRNLPMTNSKIAKVPLSPSAIALINKGFILLLFNR